MRLLCAALLTIFAASAQQFTVEQLKQKPLTNDSVVTLAKAGFDEFFIIQLIRNSRTSFDTSVQALVVMKQAGVSEDLIRMISMPQVVPPTAPVAPAAAAAKTPPPKKHKMFKIF
jgi:hypothetical protein